MNVTLYQLAADFRQQAEKLSDLNLDEQTLADTLESISGDLQTKATNVAMFVRDLQATAASIKDAEAQMAARRKAIENRATRLMAYLRDNMQTAGIEKIACPYFSLALVKNPPAVDVFDERQVPPEFMKTPPPPAATPDKTAIKAAIKAGIEVPGCRLAQGVRLDIA